MQRRRLLATAAAAPLALAAPAPRAQEIGGPLRIVVPFPPGGTSDILARLIAPSLGTRLGQNVVVENRPGAGGNIGADAVAKSRPDGTSLLLLDVSALATNPFLYARLPFDTARDLAPVQMVVYAPYVMAVNNQLPVQDAAGLAAWVKANPGRLNFAHSGIGTLTHIVGLSLAGAWGAEITAVPYRGGAPALLALVSNEANMTLQGATQSLPYVVQGQMRGIAVTGPKRLGPVPNLPTFRELGWPSPTAAPGRASWCRARRRPPSSPGWSARSRRCSPSPRSPPASASSAARWRRRARPPSAGASPSRPRATAG
jgi:tripartite-type tricarboxylate transporter receptor subunit TctC